MNPCTLISECRQCLSAASAANDNREHDDYNFAMNKLRGLLIEELAPPTPPEPEERTQDGQP